METEKKGGKEEMIIKLGGTINLFLAFYHFAIEKDTQSAIFYMLVVLLFGLFDIRDSIKKVK